MITIYAHTGGPDTAPVGYIPCLVGSDHNNVEAYFETVEEIEPATISATKPSKWFAGPSRIIHIRLNDGKLAYAMADELMTAGVDL